MSKNVNWKHKRSISIIRELIQETGLNLKGEVVLTELGSNFYLYTPLIALMAGAQKVIAVYRDSKYGKGVDIVKDFESCIREYFPNEEWCFELIENEPNANQLFDVTILTNSGNLRRIDEALISRIPKLKVIPLMYEAWELRDTDIDIDYCRREGIKVVGVNENHDAFDVFGFGGSLAVKLAMEAGFEIKSNVIVVWSKDDFGVVAAEAFRKNGAKNVYLISKIEEFYYHLKYIDFIYLCDYHETRDYFGKNGIFDLEILKEINPSLGVIHLYGEINAAALEEYDILLYPKKNGYAQQMTETLGYVGLVPILSLQICGFKTAEEVIQNRISVLSQPLTFSNL